MMNCPHPESACTATYTLPWNGRVVVCDRRAPHRLDQMHWNHAARVGWGLDAPVAPARGMDPKVARAEAEWDLLEQIFWA